MAYTVTLRAPCRLFALPQELQNMVFDFAYTCEPGSVQCFSRSSWIAREQSRWRVGRAFPGPKVDDFLVSKRFFVAAATAWTGHQDFYQGVGFAFCVTDSRDGDVAGGIVAGFARKATIFWSEIRLLPRLRKLRDLTIEVSEPLFACLEDEVTADQDVLSEKHFARVLEVHRELGELRGLLDIRLRPTIKRCAGGWSEKARVLESNKKSFVEAMRKRAMNGAVKGEVDHSQRESKALHPLYPGLAVRWGNQSEQASAQAWRAS